MRTFTSKVITKVILAQHTAYYLWFMMDCDICKCERVEGSKLFSTHLQRIHLQSLYLIFCYVSIWRRVLLWTAEYLLYFLMVRSLLQVKAYGRDFPSRFGFIFLVSMRGQLQCIILRAFNEIHWKHCCSTITYIHFHLQLFIKED